MKKLIVLIGVLAILCGTGAIVRMSPNKPIQAVLASDVGQSSILIDPRPSEADMLNDINAARMDAGISPLARDARLDTSATLKANDMITRNYWSHNAPDGTEPWVFFQKAGYSYTRAGENLAYGKFKLTQSVVNDWLNSPKHKEVMLSDEYTDVGIAIEKAAQYNGATDVYVIVTHYGHE
jgi:uncharacterized protein YkwD